MSDYDSRLDGSGGGGGDPSSFARGSNVLNSATNLGYCEALETHLRLRAQANAAAVAAADGLVPENENCRREVPEIPDLEFGAGKASSTAGCRSETLEVPATRAISAFIVGGGIFAPVTIVAGSGGGFG